MRPSYVTHTGRHKHGRNRLLTGVNKQAKLIDMEYWVHVRRGGTSALLPVVVALDAAEEQRGRLVRRARLHLVVVRLAVAALGALCCGARTRPSAGLY